MAEIVRNVGGNFVVLKQAVATSNSGTLRFETVGSSLRLFLGNTLQVREVVKRWRPVEVRYYLAAAHYRSVMEFAPAALDEAAAAYKRIENFVEKASAVVAAEAGAVPDVFARALDDGVRGHAVNPDPRQQESQRGKGAKQRAEQRDAP